LAEVIIDLNNISLTLHKSLVFMTGAVDVGDISSWRGIDYNKKT